MIELTRSPIDIERVTAAVSRPGAGATVLFLGTTRDFTRGRQTAFLDYEAHEPLARSQLERLRDLAMKKWPASTWCLVHRLGRVDLAEASVAIAVSMPHRHEAFAAASWMIDQLKETVPIWKQEHGPDGSSEWIHPAGETVVPAEVDRDRASGPNLRSHREASP